MAYCTISDVKSYMGISGSTEDTLLTSLVAVMQAEIDKFTGRSFEAATLTKYFDYAQPFELHVKDLLSVTTLTNGDGATISGSAYTLYPYNTSPKRKIIIKPGQGVQFLPGSYGNRHGVISVAGSWGYAAAVPADIEQACIELTAWAYRLRYGDAGDFQITTSGGLVRVPGKWPKHILASLLPYRGVL